MQPLTSAGALLTAETVTITVPSAGCEDMWLTDLIRSQNTMQVVIESLPELAYETPATVHEIIGRRAPIVTSDIAHTPQVSAVDPDRHAWSRPTRPPPRSATGCRCCSGHRPSMG